MEQCRLLVQTTDMLEWYRKTIPWMRNPKIWARGRTSSYRQSMESSKLRCGDLQAHTRPETQKVWATPSKSFSCSPSMASTTRKKTFWKELRTARSVGRGDRAWESHPQFPGFSWASTGWGNVRREGGWELTAKEFPETMVGLLAKSPWSKSCSWKSQMRPRQRTQLRLRKSAHYAGCDEAKFRGSLERAPQ